MLIDTHAHLNDESLKPLIGDIVKDMDKDNLESIINVGYDYSSSVYSVELADKYDKVYAAVGIHPHDAKSATADMYKYFGEAAANPKVVAIGEIGLDYYYDYSPRDTQRKVFEEQIDLAHSLNMPVIIHLRDAYTDMYDILKANRHKLSNGLVLHCYSGSAEMAEQYNEFDPYYSFGGVITFAKYKDRVIKSIPVERLLLETDCPYMTPIPFRGRLNLPKYVIYPAIKIATYLDKTLEEITDITTTNAKRLFRRLT